MGNLQKEYRSQYFMNTKIFNTVSKKKIHIKIRTMLSSDKNVELEAVQ